MGPVQKSGAKRPRGEILDPESAPRADIRLDRTEHPRVPRHEQEGGPAQESKSGSWRRATTAHPLAATGLAVLIVAAVAGGLAWWLNARHYESTDDAFIDTRIATISSQVNGKVSELAVTDNQAVDAGALLLQIDDRDYQSALAEAKAQVEQGTATLTNLDAQIDAQNARIDQAKEQTAQAQAALTFAQQENTRAQDLYSKQAGTQQTAQQTASNLRQAQSSLAAAQANQVAAEKQIAVLQTQRQQAIGQLHQAQATENQAETNLARTRVTAPVAGRATKISVAEGNFAQAGQALMMFVPNEKWVIANFKETQLTDMRPGQSVDISIDSYPGRTFRGHVASLQSGSGSVFSLLPAENATGNFVKVVQRIPVKITFDTAPDVFLGPGMSVVPSVRVR